MPHLPLLADKAVKVLPFSVMNWAKDTPFEAIAKLR